jgi:hypothetical protein
MPVECVLTKMPIVIRKQIETRVLPGGARVAFTTARERRALQPHEHLFFIQYRGVSSKYTLT